MSISNLRQEYTQNGLLENQMDADPIKQFTLWMEQAVHSGMILTKTPSGSAAPPSR